MSGRDIFLAILFLVVLGLGYIIYDHISWKSEYMKSYYSPSTPDYRYMRGTDSTGPKILEQKSKITGEYIFMNDFQNFYDKLPKTKIVQGLFQYNGEKETLSGVTAISTIIIHSGEVLSFDYDSDIFGQLDFSILNHQGASLEMCFYGRTNTYFFLSDYIPLILSEGVNNCFSIPVGKEFLFSGVSEGLGVSDIRINLSASKTTTLNFDVLAKN